VSVSAATSHPEQAEVDSAIAEAFGEHAPLARAYADILSTDGINRGVLGPREATRIWPRHLFNSVALAALIPVGARVVDLGSGAGLPGIPLAIARPDLEMVLLEPMQRRVRFLHDCLDTLGLTRVQVVAGRAEDGLPTLADVVVVRAVAPLDRLIPLAFGLLVDNGELLALKGAAANAELDTVRQAKPGKYGKRGDMVAAELITLPVVGGPVTVVRVTRPVRATRSGRAGKGPR
jgi:16S rRNA (guanine527-N7)-methyltransferase